MTALDRKFEQSEDQEKLVEEKYLICLTALIKISF